MGAEPRRDAALRVAVTAIVVADVLRLAVEIWLMRTPAYLGHATDWLGALVETPWALGALIIAALVGSVAWGRGRSTLGGATALVCLSLLTLVHSYVRGEHDESLFYAGILLAGWLVVESAARATAPRSDEDATAWGALGALGFLAGSYVMAALAKLGSASWWDGENVRLALSLAVDYAPDSLWLGVRESLAEMPWALQAISVVTVVVELCAVLLVGSDRLRAWTAMTLWAMHLGIYGCLGVLFVEPLFVLPLIGLPWHRVAAGVTSPGGPAPERAQPSCVAIALVSVGLSVACWLSAGAQAPVFSGLHDQAAESSAFAPGHGQGVPGYPERALSPRRG